MKNGIEIMHLLQYRWEGPSIGVRFRFGKLFYAFIIPITQQISDLLIKLKWGIKC